MARAKASSTYHVPRRLTQVGLLLFWTLAPWLDVFRLELQPQTVTYFGHTYPLEFPYVLGMIIPFVATIWALAFLSWRKGRVFCGWACPYSTLVELCDGLRTALWKGTQRKVAAWMRRSAAHRWSLRLGALLTFFAVPAILALSVAAYFMAPAEILRLVLRTPWGQGGALQSALLGGIAFLLLMAFLSGFVVRFHVCRWVCIYGMGQAMAASSADQKTILKPRFLPASTDACGGCQACLKACHVDLDPRDPDLTLGFGAGCFNCGECIDVCGTVQGHKDQDPFLTFRTTLKTGGK